MPGLIQRSQNYVNMKKNEIDNLTDINSSQRLSRSSLVTTDSFETSPTIVHAEDMIQNILQARKTRQRRRSDISKSLDNISGTMLEVNSLASFSKSRKKGRMIPPSRNRYCSSSTPPAGTTSVASIKT